MNRRRVTLFIMFGGRTPRAEFRGNRQRAAFSWTAFRKTRATIIWTSKKFVTTKQIPQSFTQIIVRVRLTTARGLRL
jgi:hypothetical protein